MRRLGIVSLLLCTRVTRLLQRRRHRQQRQTLFVTLDIRLAQDLPLLAVDRDRLGRHLLTQHWDLHMLTQLLGLSVQRDLQITGDAADGTRRRIHLVELRPLGCRTVLRGRQRRLEQLLFRYVVARRDLVHRLSHGSPVCSQLRRCLRHRTRRQLRDLCDERCCILVRHQRAVDRDIELNLTFFLCRCCLKFLSVYIDLAALHIRREQIVYEKHQVAVRSRLHCLVAVQGSADRALDRGKISGCPGNRRAADSHGKHQCDH